MAMPSKNSKSNLKVNIFNKTTDSIDQPSKSKELSRSKTYNLTSNILSALSPTKKSTTPI